MYGPLILHTPLTSVRRAVVNAHNVTINLKLLSPRQELRLETVSL